LIGGMRTNRDTEDKNLLQKLLHGSKLGGV